MTSTVEESQTKEAGSVGPQTPEVTASPILPKQRHSVKGIRAIVPRGASTVSSSASRTTGAVLFGATGKEQEVLDMLLECNVKTYAQAAARLGITEAAVKQRMSRLLSRYHRAKAFANEVEYWKRKRREKRGRRRN